MERITILGHSFVARLEQDLLMDGQLQFNKDLDLLSNYMVKFFGLRGATTHRILYSGQFQDCEEFHPTPNEFSYRLGKMTSEALFPTSMLFRESVEWYTLYCLLVM